MILFPRVTLSPASVFLSVWGAQVLLYSLRFTDFIRGTCEAYSVILLLFSISALPFLAGQFSVYLLCCSFKMPSNLRVYDGYSISRDQLRSFHLRCIIFSLIVLSLLLTANNMATYGPLPLVAYVSGEFGDYTYLDYGRLKYIIFASLSAVVILSYFEKNQALKYAVFIFSASMNLLYVTRAYIIQIFLHYIILSILATASNRRLSLAFRYLIFFSIFLFALMFTVGELRTGSELFKSVMDISDPYWDWPVGILWVVTYISSGLANMVSLILNNFDSFYYGDLSLAKTLPPFLWQYFSLDHALEVFLKDIPFSYYMSYKSSNVATYLGLLYMDFGYIGIVLFNFFIGLLGYFLFHIYTHSRSIFSMIMYSTFLTYLAFLFFDNWFINITNITQVLIFFLLKRFLRSHSAIPRSS